MASDSDRVANYLPNFFECNDLGRAKELILTSNNSMSTDERWEKETPYISEKIGLECGLTDRSLVLDYGCGIGRIAKAVIQRYGCRVIGVDISASMRSMALEYVGSGQFSVFSPEDFDVLLKSGMKVDHSYAVWVLQHAVDPAAEMRRVQAATKVGGRFYVVSAPGRCVPCDLGWVNDGIDLFKTITDHGMRELKKEPLDIYPLDRDEKTMQFCLTYERV